MYLDNYNELATKYRVEDLAGALIPGSRLSSILKHLELGEESISNIAQEFLQSKGLSALLNYAKKEFTFAEFVRAAEKEQCERRLLAQTKGRIAEAEALREQAEQKLKEEAMQARLRQLQKRKAVKTKQFKLREKYDLSFFIEKGDFPKLMNILRQVDNGSRLSEEEIVWLSTDGNEYFTQKLRERFHKSEAEFHAGEFKKTKDTWSAVNASSHYRKCNESNTADSILNTIDVSVLKDLKLKSALCTTHGGVKRDLKKYNAAIGLGEQAHLFRPQDFRPCTLLGAVNMEIGHYDLGQSWYGKAVKRGYSEKSVDDELRSIFNCAEKSKQETLGNHLLKIDPVRYSWVKKKPGNR